MPNRVARLASKAVQWRCFALPVLAFLAVYVAVLYRRAFNVGLLSDGWYLLEIGSRGFLKAPFVLLSYHTIPVANLFMALLWKLFGLHERWYQLTNLAELGLVAWLLYLLGCALFRQPRIGLLASLLFLANSSFYEVPFWPVVGNFQSLAALFYLAGVFAVHRAFHSPRRRLWIFVFSLCALAAFFTYEPAVSVLGVGFFYAFFMPAREGEALSWRDRGRRALAVLGPSLPAIALVLGSKLYTASQGYNAMFLPSDWETLQYRTYYLVRGCIAIFSMVAADYKIYQVFTFGLFPPLGSPAQVGFLVLWVLLFPAGAALLLWKSRSGPVRLLTLWFAVHMVTVAAAAPTAIVSRHYYLGALPAALLMAWLLWRAADAAAGRISRWGGLRMPEPQVAALLALLALTLLAVNSKSDLDTAGTLHQEATRASRRVASLVLQRLAEAPTFPPQAVLVNMPSIMSKDDIGAFAFVNGLHQILQLSTQGRVVNPGLFYTYVSPAQGRWFANTSQLITLGELNRRAHDPSSLVLIFDGRARTVIEADPTTWRPPEKYDYDSAPYLEWQSGSWPWFRVYAGQPLELPLGVSPERSWVAIRYLRNPGLAFTVTSGSLPNVEIRAPGSFEPFWPVVTFPVDGTAGVADLTINPESEVWLAGVWSFAPPAEYAPETSPFLPWIARPFPHFLVEGPVSLPVSAFRCTNGPCGVQIEYLAEQGRDFSVEVEGGSRKSFKWGDLAAPEWRSEWIATGAAGPATVRIEPQGTKPLLLRRLVRQPAAGPTG